MRVPLTLGAIAALALVTACGGGATSTGTPAGGTATPAAGTATPAAATATPAAEAVICHATGEGSSVTVENFSYDPASASVGVGGFVTWTNNDNFSHTVRLLDSDDVQLMRPGESVTHAFPAPGLYRYDCSLHPKDMQGSVLVEIAPE